MNKFKSKALKTLFAMVLIFILIFNIIMTKSYSATLSVTTESNNINENSEFNYTLNFDDTIITLDTIIEFDEQYIEFVEINTPNMEYNKIENGKMVCIYVDENGIGTNNVTINFKVKDFEQKFSTQIKIIEINAYALEKGKAYSTSDFNLDNTIMTISSNGKREEKPNKENNSIKNNNVIDDVGAITNTTNNVSNNDFIGNLDININNVGNVKNNNSEFNNNGDSNNKENNNNNNIKISTPNEDNKAKGILPATGKPTSMLAIILLIILIIHSIISFIKYHKKQTNFFIVFAFTIILLKSISLANGNIIIQNFERIKNFEHLIVIMPDLDNRNLKVDDFINLEKSKDFKITQVKDSNGKKLNNYDYIATGNIVYLSKELTYRTLVYGDVNSDGNVNSNDIAEILIHKLNNVELEGIFRKSANLYNENDLEDKEIDSNDINILKQYILRIRTDNLVEEFPTELAKSIKIVTPKNQLNIGEELQLSVITEPEDMNVSDIRWSSNNEDIIKVDDEGNIVAKSAGTANITVISESDSYLNDTIEIKVISQVTGVKLTHKKLELEIGESKRISSIVEPLEAQNRNVLWSTSNSRIAKVDEKGTITAIDEGQATITVTTEEGKFIDTCEVTVLEEDIQRPNISYVNGVVINKSSTVIRVGQKEILEAYVVPANAIDTSVYWETSDSNIVRVNENGEIEGVSLGFALVKAISYDGGYSDSCVVQVDKTPVESISLNEEEINMYKDETVHLTPTIYPIDATYKDIIWSTNNSNIANVNENGEVIATGIGSATITAKSVDSGVTATCNIIVETINIENIELDEDEIDFWVGETDKINVKIEPDDANNQKILWETSNEDICTVDNFGSIKAIKKGKATITAKTENGKHKAECKITVYEDKHESQKNSVESVTLNENVVYLDKGSIVRLIPTVNPENADNKNVKWKSNDNKIATVNENGEITGIKAGTTRIIVTTEDGHKEAACIVTVRPREITGIKLNKEKIKVGIGTTQTLSVIIEPEDADNKTIQWMTMNNNIADISSDGLVTGKSEGITNIIAKTLDGEYIAECEVTVEREIRHVDSIELDKNYITLEVEGTEKLTEIINPEDADNKDVSWSSTDDEIVSVDDCGNITAKKVGEAKIIVTTDDGKKTAECVVKVKEKTRVELDKNNVELEINEKCELKIIITPDSEEKEWNIYSYDSNIINIEKTDNFEVIEIQGVTSGKTKLNIEVLLGKEKRKFDLTCDITVKREPIPVTNIILDNDEINLYCGMNKKLVATIEPEDADNKNVIWSSSDEEIATVSDNGEITALKEGNVEITATTQDGEKIAICKVNVNKIEKPVTNVILDKNELTLEEEQVENLTATIEPEDADNKNIIWSSSDKNIVTVDNEGKVTAYKEGIADIIVTTKDGEKSATCRVTVNKKKRLVENVILNKNELILEEGQSETLVATINPNNADNKNVSWFSNNEEVAEVKEGKILAKKAGKADITVKTEDGEKTATCKVTVNMKKIRPTKVELDKKEAILYIGESDNINLKATITPNNCNTDNTLQWSSNNSKIATVDSNGLVKAVSNGQTTIKVKTANNYGAECKIIVHTKPKSIKLNKDTLNLDLSGTKQEKLLVTFEPRGVDIYNKLTWSSSDSSIASVSSDGTVKAKANGTVEIKVDSENGKTAKCIVNVQTSLTDIELKENNIVLNSTESNNTSQLNVVKYPTTANANDKLTWSSSNKDVATVDSNGKVTAVGTGTAEIKVLTENNKSKTCQVTVNTSPTSVSLDKTNIELDKSVKENKSIQLNCTISPSNVNVKNSLTWSSSNTDVATVDKNGKVVAKANGTATITVKTENNKSATCKVTVHTSPTSIKIIASDSRKGLKATAESIAKNKSITLNYEIKPQTADINTKVTWKSNNKHVSLNKTTTNTSNGSGKITVKGETEGLSKITATTENGIKVELPIAVQFQSTIKMSECSRYKLGFSGKKSGNTTYGTVLQSITSTKDYYIVNYKSSNDTNNAVITKYKKSDMSTKKSNTPSVSVFANYGHVNCSTYCDKNDKLYFGIWADNATENKKFGSKYAINKVSEIKKDAKFNTSRNKYTSLTNKNGSELSISGMAYDYKDRKMYTSAGTNIRISDINKDDKLDYQKVFCRLSKVGDEFFQDIGVFDGVVFSIVCTKGFTNKVDLYLADYGVYIGTYKISGTSEELESLTYDQYKKKFIFGINGSPDSLYVTKAELVDKIIKKLQKYDSSIKK